MVHLTKKIQGHLKLNTQKKSTNSWNKCQLGASTPFIGSLAVVFRHVIWALCPLNRVRPSPPPKK